MILGAADGKELMRGVARCQKLEAALAEWKRDEDAPLPSWEPWNLRNGSPPVQY